MNRWRPLWILTEREFTSRIVKRGYWLFTLFGLIIMVGLTFLPTILHWASALTTDKIVLDDPNHFVSPSIQRYLNEPNAAAKIQLHVVSEPNLLSAGDSTLIHDLKGWHSSLLIVVHGDAASDATFTLVENGVQSPSTVATVTSLLTQATTDIRLAGLSAADRSALVKPIVLQHRQLQKNSQSSDAYIQSMTLVYFMEVLLLMTMLIYGMWVAQGTIEEKSNRLIEMMLITVRPWQILFGKILGVFLVGLVQYAIWTVCVLVSMGFQKHLSTLPFQGVPVTTLLWFPVFFTLGYFCSATLFGIGGALVHRVEEQQMAVTPISFLMAIAFYAGMFVLPNPHSSFAVIVSFIPVVSTISMFARLALADIPLWQVLISVALNMLVIWGLLLAGAKIYKRYALHTTGPAGWKLLFKKSAKQPQSADVPS